MGLDTHTYKQWVCMYLVVEPVLSIQSAKVIHGQNMAFVVDPEGFSQGWARRTLEGLY